MTSIQAQYVVYNDLETAETRMLLPSKVGTGLIGQSDAALDLSTLNSETVPECIVPDKVCSLCSFLLLRFP